MKTLSFDKNKIKALIQLLDDPNNEVYDLVEKEILSGGSELIPYLQEGFDHSNNELQKTRLATLLEKTVKLTTTFQSKLTTNFGAN